ncbi:hypothetical protein HanRHA438_Chr01g0011921 [Helianthus annuus]|uniref:Uncharacterized protein n=1 Tax=Helianthus annuus TaxID=4232 RepID=A0A9K3JU96_HELAN|nr:hypothetical protein HanXRQr2_Chr01g0011601 [Helianthus annuus]KAJ0626209.1 hypothetical protein HanHA89_Chr01g0010461 [Helianthus annuus]KAJ0782541.1 hypothetical protein HanLR1_Chr01g0009401 [Helianthus annuus]KAJ0947145.1 hypothetical protein HanRHA438_Chr01g0011921 [Helianthus annuus]KAJ0956160.1 hypothetical protein HanPSC8_Chr01g0011431 [Helianthus annuus]
MFYVLCIMYAFWMTFHMFNPIKFGLCIQILHIYLLSTVVIQILYIFDSLKKSPTQISLYCHQISIIGPKATY